MKRILLLVLLFAAVQLVWAQRTVSGRVTDSAGEGLPGVTVRIEGTSQGTTTDVDGRWQLSISGEDVVLLFTSVGMEDQREVVGNRTIIDVAMAVKTSILQEVVVTGYGVQDIRKSASSISTVKSARIEQVPIGSFANILQGNATGLLSTSGTGAPGTTGKVLIRGNSSINSAVDPLYVLDGVPIESGTFATLNPNDFESVTVLKDASATAIYGSRAANGVIVITTKKGQVGPPVMQYRFQTGWGFKPQEKFMFDLMSTDQKIEWELLTGAGLANTLSGEQLDSLRQINTDWEDIIFRTGRFNSHEISASGGNEVSRFFTSLNYFSQEGISLASRLDRYTFRVNYNHEISEKLRFGNTLSVGWSRESQIPVDGGANTNNPWAALSLLNPYDVVRDPVTGEYWDPSGLANNVVAIANTHEDIRDETKIVSSLFVEYDIIPGLTARSNWGIDYRARRFSNLVPPGSLSGFPGPQERGSLTRTFNRRPRFVGTNSLTYTKTFAERHNLSVGLYHEMFYQKFEFETTQGFGLDRIFLPDGTTPGDAGANSAFIPAFSGSERDEALLSYFANVVYDFDGKYVLNATIRRDGSSRFGANNRFANFWSLGLAWNVSDEGFFNVGFIDDLRYRMSYGTTGNKNVRDETNYFPALETYDVTRTFDGEVAQVASSPGNPDLKWETNNKFNMGVDFTVLGGKLNGSLDYYNELTTDVFLTQQLSRTTGFTSLDINAGKIRNSGVEVQLNSDIVRTEDLLVNLFVNATYNKNEVVDLGQVNEFELGTSIIREGEPIGSHYFVRYAGYNQANGQPLYLDRDGNITTVFTDDNKVDGLGTSEAPHFGGFGANVSYRNFQLNFLFAYVYDIKLYNNTRWFQVNPDFAGSGAIVEALDRWQQPGDVEKYHSIDYPLQQDTKFLEDASFLRLRNVTLAYNVPASLLDGVNGISSVRVYAQGQNLLTWTKWQGLDPEDSNNLQVFPHPQPRTITVGLDLTF